MTGPFGPNVDVSANTTPSTSLLQYYHIALDTIIAASPITLSPPIHDLPKLGSAEELAMIYSFLLELLPYAMAIRVQILKGGFSNVKSPALALSVFRCPMDIKKAAVLLGRLNVRYVISSSWYTMHSLTCDGIVRMIVKFGYWRLNWVRESPPPPSLDIPAYWKARACES